MTPSVLEELIRFVLAVVTLLGTSSFLHLSFEVVRRSLSVYVTEHHFLKDCWLYEGFLLGVIFKIIVFFGFVVLRCPRIILSVLQHPGSTSFQTPDTSKKESSYIYTHSQMGKQ